MAPSLSSPAAASSASISSSRLTQGTVVGGRFVTLASGPDRCGIAVVPVTGTAGAPPEPAARSASASPPAPRARTGRLATLGDPPDVAYTTATTNAAAAAAAIKIRPVRLIVEPL